MDPMTSNLQIISSCTIKPRYVLEESQQPCYLTPWDVGQILAEYIQSGLVFPKPQHIPMQTMLVQLQDSLSTTLTHFFPLTGRLVTKTTSTAPPSSYTFLNCQGGGGGAEFVHAAIEATISDILSPKDVPRSLVQLLFPLGIAFSTEGHTLPLLAVQVTELIDGIFIGCSFNHVVGDGYSFWHFINSWSEVCRSGGEAAKISRPPITNHWFLNDHNPIITLPCTHPSELINRDIRKQPYRERIFHFPSQSIAQLKANANVDIGTNKISSFQALGALVWRAVIRARRLLDDEATTCAFPVDNRSRLNPPLPSGYFGNCVHGAYLVTTVGELLSNSLGWSAWKFHLEVADQTDNKARLFLSSFHQEPYIINFGDHVNPTLVGFSKSHWFDVYNNDFGWGKPIAVRSGITSKFDGQVTWYPGREGGGSVALEICLSPESMKALEEDDEFMSAVSPHTPYICQTYSSLV